MLSIEKKVKKLNDNFKKVVDIAKQLEYANDSLQQKIASLEQLIEELANEFMYVTNGTNAEEFTGEELFVYKANERLAAKVNKALGLVK